MTQRRHCRCKVEDPTVNVRADCYRNTTQESVRTWKVSHSSTKSRNKSSISSWSFHKKIQLHQLCGIGDSGERASSPSRTAKRRLSRRANRHPQPPSLPNQEACVGTWAHSKRDCSPTSTGRLTPRAEEPLGFFRCQAHAVLDLHPLPGPIGSGRRCLGWDLDGSRPPCHSWLGNQPRIQQ